MNTKDNQRTRLSKMLFKNAMMDLLEEKKSVDKISVKELCERAELNRSTFYAHYNEPKDLFDEICDNIIEATQNHLVKIALEYDVTGAYKYLMSFLEYIKNNDKQFRTLLLDTDFKFRFMQQSIIQYIDNMHFALPPDIEQYVFSYILHGSTGIITQWIRSDYSLAEEKIVELLFSLNKNAIGNIAINNL